MLVWERVCRQEEFLKSPLANNLPYKFLVELTFEKFSSAGMLTKPLAEVKGFLHRLHCAGKSLNLSNLDLRHVAANAFYDLAHLQELNLSSNKLDSLPHVVGTLHALK